MIDRADRHVAVFGASGHTGRFVVAELLGRGYVPLLLGRDQDKLLALARTHPGLEARPASVVDPASLDRAVAGAAAVINCAGPFATTAAPVIEAALRAGIPYVDVAAEVEANADTFAHFADRARAAGTVVVPAMAFFGGLGDLLVTTAMNDWTTAGEAHIAYGLSSWHPTPGTLIAGAVSGERRGGRRVRYTGSRLAYHDDPLPRLDWDFPAPLGPRSVLADFTMADVVTVPSHLAIPEVRTYMTVAAAADLAAAAAPPPAARTPLAAAAAPPPAARAPSAAAAAPLAAAGAPLAAVASPPTAVASPPVAVASPPAVVDEHGRSVQTFVVDVRVRSGGTERRVAAAGQDIYAVSAPLAVEAVDRILTGRARTTGVTSAGAAFDAPDFLRALSPHLSLHVPPDHPVSDQPRRATA